MTKQTAVEWLIEQINKHWDNKDVNSDELIKQAKEMEKQQTEISDEEIEKAAKFYKWKINQTFFEEGAKWYREQLKKKQ